MTGFRGEDTSRVWFWGKLVGFLRFFDDFRVFRGVNRWIGVFDQKAQKFLSKPILSHTENTLSVDINRFWRAPRNRQILLDNVTKNFFYKRFENFDFIPIFVYRTTKIWTQNTGFHAIDAS